ncbi:hypothetical protein EPN29_12630 [bacterium]|nr:MAG: hypothetical protein EPN29_12630 [bacterium]
MAEQDFARLVEGESELLRLVERIVVESHRRLYESEGRPWSRAIAYRWLRYEDPAPVARLRDGVKWLRQRGASFDADAVEKACKKALISGFLN